MATAELALTSSTNEFLTLDDALKYSTTCMEDGVCYPNVPRYRHDDVDMGWPTHEHPVLCNPVTGCTSFAHRSGDWHPLAYFDMAGVESDSTCGPYGCGPVGPPGHPQYWKDRFRHDVEIAASHNPHVCHDYDECNRNCFENGICGGVCDGFGSCNVREEHVSRDQACTCMDHVVRTTEIVTRPRPTLDVPNTITTYYDDTIEHGCAVNNLGYHLVTIKGKNEKQTSSEIKKTTKNGKTWKPPKATIKATVSS